MLPSPIQLPTSAIRQPGRATRPMRSASAARSNGEKGTSSMMFKDDISREATLKAGRKRISQPACRRYSSYFGRLPAGAINSGDRPDDGGRTAINGALKHCLLVGRRIAEGEMPAVAMEEMAVRSAGRMRQQRQGHRHDRIRTDR